ncbi:MAG: response regulator [Acidobacteria bacterium]|nr:response regulator [Acidobacteriota bacterium]
MERVGGQTTSKATLPSDATVLVVEDNEYLLEVTCELLRMSGHTPLAARTGSEALVVLNSYGGMVDVLLTDMNLPDICGDEVARRVIELRPEVRIVYVSSFPASNFIRRGQIPPDAIFLDKPFLQATLVERVREALASRS